MPQSVPAVSFLFRLERLAQPTLGLGNARGCVREAARRRPAGCIGAVAGCNDHAVARRRLFRLEIGRCRPEPCECGGASVGEQTEPVKNCHLRQLRLQLEALAERILGCAVGVPDETGIVRRQEPILRLGDQQPFIRRPPPLGPDLGVIQGYSDRTGQLLELVAIIIESAVCLLRVGKSARPAIRLRLRQSHERYQKTEGIEAGIVVVEIFGEPCLIPFESIKQSLVRDRLLLRVLYLKCSKIFEPGCLLIAGQLTVRIRSFRRRCCDVVEHAPARLSGHHAVAETLIDRRQHQVGLDVVGQILTHRFPCLSRRDERAQPALRPPHEAQAFPSPRHSSGFIAQQRQGGRTIGTLPFRPLDHLPKRSRHDDEACRIWRRQLRQQSKHRAVGSAAFAHREHSLPDRLGQQRYRSAGILTVVCDVAVGLQIERRIFPGRRKPNQDRALRPQPVADAELVEDIGIVDRDVGDHEIVGDQHLEHVDPDVAGLGNYFCRLAG